MPCPNRLVSNLVSNKPDLAAGLCIFPMFCRYFRSGGTRTRTGDTMVFSHVLYLPSCTTVYRNTPRRYTVFERIVTCKTTLSYNAPGRILICDPEIRSARQCIRPA